jgi:mannose-6-phosphate isomerase-like protein (cupin superfamily)
MPIQSRVDIADAAAQLQEPFSMTELAQVGELSASVYLCHGAIAWHRHLDEDELFLVQSGLIALESEWGAATLSPGELVVVPKGIGHRSLSAQRSHVLLFRPWLLAGRKNGHGRTHGIPTQGMLRKVNIADAVPDGAPLYEPRLMAEMSQYRMWALRCWGRSDPMQPKPGTVLLIGQLGTALVETEDGQAAPLAANELLTLSHGTRYRITAPQPAIVLQVGRDASP